MQFDIALRITPSFGMQEYAHAAGVTQAELARDLQGLAAQVQRIGSETRTLLALIAELQNVTRGSTSHIGAAVQAVANQAGRIADAVSA